MSEYCKNNYGAPSDIGRRVEYKGVGGIIYNDGGNYVSVNLDIEKPGKTINVHPNDEDLKYLEMGSIRKATKSQARYARYLSYSDCFESFIDFCYWDADKERTWN